MSFPKLASLSLDTADLDQLVPGTEHSLQSLLDALRGGCPQFVEMEGAQEGGLERIKAESIDGQGLMSSIFRVSFCLRGGRQFDAIFKITTTEKLEKIKPMEIDALQRANGPYAMEELRRLLFEMARLEADFYEEVIPRVPNDWYFLPRAFAILRSPNELQIERGFALIEDLSPRGVMPDLYEGLTREQVESALVHLAKFHAISMTFPPELMARFCIKQYGILKGLEEEILVRVLNMGSSYFLCHQKTLAAFLQVHHSLRTDVHTKLGTRPVLCHGDFWANNLFFGRNEEGLAGPQLCAIIDWQTPHANTGLNDVLRLIFSGVNAPLRKEMFWQWLDLYFDTVQEEAAKLGVSPPVEFSAQLRRALYEEQLTFAFLALPTLFPGAKTEKQQRNLQERIESLFEERRREYEKLVKGKRGRNKLCNFI